MSYADKFSVYGPYKKKTDGRLFVITINNETGDRKTISYPKWLMECQLGRTLDPDLETVDHFDSNKDNNSLDNLKIIDRKTHSENDTRRVKMVKLKCSWCGKEFERSPRIIRDKAKKGTFGNFCGRNCSGKYSRSLQLKLIDRFAPQQHIESEYYKKKYVEASNNSSIIIPQDFIEDFLCNIYDDSEE